MSPRGEKVRTNAAVVNTSLAYACGVRLAARYWMALTPPRHDSDIDNAGTIAALHARTQKTVDTHQRLIERLTTQVGRPRTIYLLCLTAAVWILFNATSRDHAIDRPPFVWLQGALSLYAALVTTIVLTTQNRQQRHAEQRAYLDLQVNLIAEQKTAKVIELLEELRRDLPSVRNRTDPEADAMQHAVNPTEVLSALEETLETRLSALPTSDDLDERASRP